MRAYWQEMTSLLAVIVLAVIGLFLWGALRKRPGPPETAARERAGSESRSSQPSAAPEPTRERLIGAPHTFDAAGLKITVQGFVREKGAGEKLTPDQLKQRESRERADQDYFNQAFWQVVKGIEAPQEALKALSPALYQASVDLREASRIIELHLPAGTWRWAAYEKYAAERDREIDEAADAEDIETVRAELEGADLQNLLQRKSLSELKGLYANVGGVSLTGRATKRRLAEAIVGHLSADDAESTRREIIAQTLQRLAYSEMAELLAHRVTMKAHWQHRRDQMLEITNHLPYWMFSAVDDDRTPEPCRKIDGTVRLHSDAFWQTHYPPCEHLFCRCSVIALSERDVQKCR